MHRLNAFRWSGRPHMNRQGNGFHTASFICILKRLIPSHKLSFFGNLNFHIMSIVRINNHKKEIFKLDQNIHIYSKINIFPHNILRNAIFIKNVPTWGNPSAFWNLHHAISKRKGHDDFDKKARLLLSLRGSLKAYRTWAA